MRPGLKCSSGLLLSAGGCIDKRSGPTALATPKLLDQTRPKGTGNLRMGRKTWFFLLKSALVAKFHSYHDPREDHPTKKRLTPEILSWGPHRDLLPTGRC